MTQHLNEKATTPSAYRLVPFVCTTSQSEYEPKVVDAYADKGISRAKGRALKAYKEIIVLGRRLSVCLVSCSFPKWARAGIIVRDEILWRVVPTYLLR